MIELRCTTEDLVHLKVRAMTKTWKPAAPIGNPEVTILAGDGSCEVDRDTGAILLTPGDAPGDTVYRIAHKADLGDGPHTIERIVVLHVKDPLDHHLEVGWEVFPKGGVL